MIATDKAWSFSQLNNFETCPKKYYHYTIRKDVKEPEGEAIIRGKYVHKALENLIEKGLKLPGDLAYMESFMAPYVAIQATKLTEQQLAITSDFEPCDWFDRKTWVRAVIDLAIVGETHAALIDYKTGRPKDDGFTQLKLAAAVFMLHNPQIQTVDMAYLWTEHSGMLTKGRTTRHEIPLLWNELLPRVSTFQQAYRTTTYPPRPSGICVRWCAVEDCPHHGGG